MNARVHSRICRLQYVLLLGLPVLLPAASLAGDLAAAPVAEDHAEQDCRLFNFEGDAEGYVDLSFTVTTEGSVRDPWVIRSDACVESAIPSMERAAIKAVLDFKYRPRVVDGEAVDVEGVRTRITFRLEDEEEESEESETSELDASDGEEVADWYIDEEEILERD
ncbi:MAG: energy transducer TonB [Woeseiaceae bacterium]|nr:energy transducer TonB [Woeseiaceae bacterium]